jgi:hypothetical protein
MFQRAVAATMEGPKSRVRFVSNVLGMALALSALTATHATAGDPTPARTTPLTGIWKSMPEEITLTTDFDESVWGKNAKSVRTVDLSIRAGGEATLTVTRKVVDARGRTVKGSASIEEAQLRLGDARPTVAGRSEIDANVTSAERRYPDDPGSRWPLDGVRVLVAAFADEPSTLEIRFETPEGRGSFWEKVHRGTRKPASTP